MWSLFNKLINKFNQDCISIKSFFSFSSIINNRWIIFLFIIVSFFFPYFLFYFIILLFYRFIIIYLLLLLDIFFIDIFFKFINNKEWKNIYLIIIKYVRIIFFSIIFEYPLIMIKYVRDYFSFRLIYKKVISFLVDKFMIRFIDWFFFKLYIIKERIYLSLIYLNDFIDRLLLDLCIFLIFDHYKFKKHIINYKFILLDFISILKSLDVIFYIAIKSNVYLLCFYDFIDLYLINYYKKLISNNFNFSFITLWICNNNFWFFYYKLRILISFIIKKCSFIIFVSFNSMLLIIIFIYLFNINYWFLILICFFYIIIYNNYIINYRTIYNFLYNWIKGFNIPYFFSFFFSSNLFIKEINNFLIYNNKYYYNDINVYYYWKKYIISLKYSEYRLLLLFINKCKIKKGYFIFLLKNNNHFLSIISFIIVLLKKVFY